MTVMRRLLLNTHLELLELMADGHGELATHLELLELMVDGHGELATHLELLELMVDGHGELALAHSVPVDDHLNVTGL